ncbi:MAG TPA: MFS transporter [Terracidiphilus sp.]|nr:MFS transporter [Terracidiphilus sp.]
MSALAAMSDIEARVTRKLRLRILPFVMLLYFVSFLDRVNVGFAAFSMNQAIGLTSSAYGFGSGIFFLGYIIFQVPANLIMVRVGARVWIARVVIVWGLVSVASAFVIGPHSFYTLRFMLGLAESGFFPGTIFYLSLWFPARERAQAIAVFMAAAPLSTAIGSPISGALMELPRFLGLMNWQWLYIIEALPAIVLGFLTYKVLTDKPAGAKWLDAEERQWLVATLDAESIEASTHTAKGDGKRGSVWNALRDPRVLALALVYAGSSAGLYVLGLWSPLILKQFGFSALTIGWLNSAPSLVAVAAMILWARHSDITLERTWHVAIPCLVAFIGFVWAGEAQAALGVILALTLVNIGVNGTKGPVWAMPSMFLTGAGAAAGIALINSMGNVGGFVGPVLIGWMKDKWGSYAPGLYTVGAMCAMSAVVIVVLALKPRQLPTAPEA